MSMDCWRQLNQEYMIIASWLQGILHQAGILLEQRVVLHDLEAVVVLLQYGH